MKKAVVFDFGQTLADSADGFRRAEREAQLEIFSHIGVPSWEDFQSHYRLTRKSFQERSDFSRKAMWIEVCRHFGVSAELAFFVEQEGRYWDTVEEHTKIFPETMDTLERLRLKYRLAVITNTQGQANSSRHRLWRFPDMEKFFERIIVAGKSGIPPKPDPLPFRLCLEGLGVLPENAAYVGDDLRIDIYGAIAVGIQPVWIKHYSVRRAWPDVSVHFPVITSLDQLIMMDRIIFGV
jgi:HAD superfamily hydrolase (TIGR01549 family)